ncbi:hypothetical protein [uncultured Arcticibacterium sp.]|uniref:hypothetical protein n=1 Tax=uncultured Arcticibacterium sp. TaxID=2173042 RepID=UPI0030F554D9
MMRTFLFLSLLSISFLSFSQDNVAYFLDKISTASSGSRIDVNADGDTILVSEYNAKNVRLNTTQAFEKKYLGTPYFKNGWFKEKVLLEGGEPVEGLIAFNLEQNTLYYSKNKSTPSVELKPLEFRINGHNFSRYEDEIKGAGDYYYETLSYSEPMLLKLYDCKFIPSSSGVSTGYGSSNSSIYEGEFEKRERFYLVVDNKMVLVSHKKSFLKNLGKYSETASSIVKKDKLNMKKQGDILSLSKSLSEI